MRTRLRSAARVSLVVAAGMLLGVGCNGGITLPPGSEDLKPCGVVRISVEDLHESGGCDLDGVLVTLPDGTDAPVPVPERAATVAYSNLVIVNLGKMGTLVEMRDPEEGLRLWGTPEAVEAYMSSYTPRRGS